MNRLLTLALAVLALSACTADPGTITSTAGTATFADSAADENAATYAAPFGGAVTYKDGLVVTVSKPSPFTPSNSSFGLEPGSTAVKFTVKVTNGTAAPFDAPMVVATLTAGESGTQAAAIIDTLKGVDPNFAQKVLPGRSASVTAGFSVPEDAVDDLQMQVGFNDLQHESALFTGGL